MDLTSLIKAKIRDIPDFPKSGILFKDITPLLQDREAFRRVIDCLAERYRPEKIDDIVAIESRGFIFGSALAYKLGAAFVPVRKKGKLPHQTVDASYELEYGTAEIEIHTDGVKKGNRVVVIDDLLATGGTAEATCALVEKVGGKVVECAFVVELAFLKGRDKLKNREIFSLVQY
ncbi:MAG: adenine phosphoribosyltransferase [Deltaproteobacteria bacterium]|nr:adenine phosphoribosyltransferase [Deltaproteobacteria bacterium]